MSAYATPAGIWAAGLVFTRIAGLIMVIPGVGETYVPATTRLSLSLLLALCILPIAAPTLPPIPQTLGDLFGQI